MGIEPTNKSLVSVQFGQGSVRFRFGLIGVLSMFGSFRFDLLETVVWVQFRSVLVYQSHKNGFVVHVYFAFGSTV